MDVGLKLVLSISIVLVFLILGTSLTTSFTPGILGGPSSNAVYKNEQMGISIEYPSNWKNSFKGLECLSFTSIGRCIAIFSPEELNFFFITVDYPSIEGNPLIQNGCECKTLLDFVQWNFKTLKSSPGFVFLNDSQMTLPGNHSAWLMEYTKLLGVEKHYEILTMVDNAFYSLDYSALSNGPYDKYFPYVKKVIDSIEFFPVVKSKEPSFISP